MRSIFRVFRYELTRQSRRGGYLFVSIGLPLIAIALFYGIQAYQRVKSSTPDTPITVTTPQNGGSANTQNSNQSDQNNGQGAGSFFKSAPIGLVDQANLITPRIDISPLQFYPSAAAANAALNADKIGAYYLIPASYLQDGTLQLWMTRFNISNTLSSGMRSILTQALAQKVGGLDPQTMTRLTERAGEVTNHRLSETNQLSRSADTGTSIALVYGFALAFVFGTFMTSGYLMQSVMEEKENRIMEVLLSSMRARDLLAGKVLALGLLGLIQLAFWAATAVFLVSQISLISTIVGGLQITGGQLLILFAYFVVGYLMFAAVYAGIGAIANNLREGPQFAVFFTLPALTPLYLVSFFASQPDSPLAVGLSLFPVTAPVAMIMRVAISPVPAWQIAVSLTLVLLTGIALMWAAGRLFRVVTLLSGQAPRLQDLPRLIRESA